MQQRLNLFTQLCSVNQIYYVCNKSQGNIVEMKTLLTIKEYYIIKNFIHHLLIACSRYNLHELSRILPNNIYILKLDIVCQIHLA